jgi:hypothetical protein
MLQAVEQRELNGSLPQKLGGGGLRFEVQEMVCKRGIEALSDEIFEGVVGDLHAALKVLMLAKIEGLFWILAQIADLLLWRGNNEGTSGPSSLREVIWCGLA